MSTITNRQHKQIVAAVRYRKRLAKLGKSVVATKAEMYSTYTSYDQDRPETNHHYVGSEPTVEDLLTLLLEAVGRGLPLSTVVKVHEDRGARAKTHNLGRLDTFTVIDDQDGPLVMLTTESMEKSVPAWSNRGFAIKANPAGINPNRHDIAR